jgi:hypothetical protein
MISIEGCAGTISRLSGLGFALGPAMRRGWPVNVPRKTRISLLQQPAGCPCGGPVWFWVWEPPSPAVIAMRSPSELKECR